MDLITLIVAAPAKWRKLMLESLLENKDTFEASLQDNGSTIVSIYS